MTPTSTISSQIRGGSRAPFKKLRPNNYREVSVNRNTATETQTLQWAQGGSKPAASEDRVPPQTRSDLDGFSTDCRRPLSTQLATLPPSEIKHCTAFRRPDSGVSSSFSGGTPGAPRPGTPGQVVPFWWHCPGRKPGQSEIGCATQYINFILIPWMRATADPKPPCLRKIVVWTLHHNATGNGGVRIRPLQPDKAGQGSIRRDRARYTMRSA